MILGVYIFIKRGRKFVFKRELASFDEMTHELIDNAILKTVNQFENYEEGVYRIPLEENKKILFSVYGEVLSLVFIQSEIVPGDEELTSDVIDANDALFASIVFNQPLLTELIHEEASQEKFTFYKQKLPDERKTLLEKAPAPKSELKPKVQHYIQNLDSIIGEVNVNLNNALRETAFTPEKEPLTIQAVFSKFTELTFRYARMYLMEHLIRDLIEDHAGRPISEIKMGINDFLFYFRKSIHVLKDRPEIKYFLKIMDGHKIGIQIKDRTFFTVSFSGETIQISDELSKEDPLVYFGSVDLVINLILGRLDVLKVALSKSVRATKLHQLVEWSAPFAAILIRIYEDRFDDKKLSIKRLTLEGLAQLVQALFMANLEANPQKRAWIQGINKTILLNIIDKGTLTLIIKGEKIDVKVGSIKKDPDVIIQGSLEDICLYANNEVSFITALRKIKILKGFSMHPIDIIKGKTFTQLSELFTLWRISRI
ncbi:MAG TPA: SCP2 sterol-binding domain-containing protein [Candidatus Deferrimicrobium sp.]|nr:SCP2 sterol-binding domain-containing protein [Candidatus Deferrimicrobium sp.]